ncbi:MAG: flagellar basal-body rod protein FlgF [Gammaproteobacteria bacterium]|nr:flagellar basal-body rod protein FlgF [Gammaproteobacteria bacterium]
MDRMIYVAMNGAQQTMLAQSIHTHNLANVSTTGFRADLAVFQSLPVSGPGWASRTYAQPQASEVDLTQGQIMNTGRELDVAINGVGFIAVQAPDGSEAYTRTGDLQISPNGLLETGAGHPVLGNGGPIALPPAEKIEIGADGTISIRPVGQSATTLAIVDRIRLVNPPPESLGKSADGLLRDKEGIQAVPDAKIRLISGALEGSNVNAVEAMVSIIALARGFEVQVKLMKAAEETDSASAQLMRLG